MYKKTNKITFEVIEKPIVANSLFETALEEAISEPPFKPRMDANANFTF